MEQDVGRPTATCPRSLRSPEPVPVSAHSGDGQAQERYVFTNGWTMMRKRVGLRWHLRSEDGALIDKDRYRYDLIGRHRLTVAEHRYPA